MGRQSRRADRQDHGSAPDPDLVAPPLGSPLRAEPLEPRFVRLWVGVRTSMRSAPPPKPDGWMPKAVPLVEVQEAKPLGGFRAEP